MRNSPEGLRAAPQCCQRNPRGVLSSHADSTRAQDVQEGLIIRDEIDHGERFVVLHDLCLQLLSVLQHARQVGLLQARAWGFLGILGTCPDLN